MSAIQVPKGRLSYSASKTMHTCGFKYQRQYVWESPEASNSALILGNVVDDALTWADRAQLAGKPRPSGEQIAQYAEPLVAQKVGLAVDRVRKPVEWKDDDSPDKLRADARAMIVAYESHFAGRIHPKMTQESFVIPFEGTDVVLSGRLDLYTVEGDVIDRKTTAKSMSEIDVTTSDQLTFYQIPIVARGLPMKRLGLHVMVRLKGGVTIQELYAPPRTDATRDRALAGWLATVRAIESGEFVPADEWMTCSWCGYLEECHPDWYALKQARKAAKRGAGA